MLLRLSNLLKNSSLLLLLVSLLAACDGNGYENPGASSDSGSQLSTPQISLNFSGQELREVDTEVILQNNCGGTVEVNNQDETSYTVEHTMEVGGGFEVNANGQVGIAGTGIGLGTSVASDLGYGYGVSETLTKSITVAAAAGKDMQHIIEISEIWVIGNAQVTIENQQYSIPFKFRKDFQLTLQSSQIMKDCTSTSQSPLEQLAGNYRLASWNETVDILTLGVDAPEGSLTIDANGAADWLIHIKRRGTDPRPIPQIKCGGQVRLSSQQIEGFPDGHRNGTINVGDDFGDSDMLFLTFCGWSYLSGASSFSLYLALDGNGNTILEMKNSKGTFTWQK